MLAYTEYQETMLVHALQPSGPVPTIADEEGIYPYESFCETSQRPSLRKLRMIAIENRYLKVTVCPDLGGRVQSIVHKASGKEVLFDAGAVRPVRILPRMAFISGGIEVSFPISHTPVQIETVHARVQQAEDRIYVWCGERELRYGMQWTVEYSLGEDDAFLTQRTLFYNPTSQSHAWMSWSNAALPARPDSEFHFPSGRVLRHADLVEEIEWDRTARHTLADYDRMQGFFWRTADCCAFGMFTPSLGSGLYHIADSAVTPGMKLWLYGIGRDEPWAHATAARIESYVEIQAGPLLEQSENTRLEPGDRHLHAEFWLPAAEPADIRELALPKPRLIDPERIPLFDWVPRGNRTAPWLQLEEAFRLGDPQEIPVPPAAEECAWPPSGMEHLGAALRWATASARAEDQPLWGYYLGVWLAGRGQIEQAVESLEAAGGDWSHALRGRLLRLYRGDREASREAFGRIASPAWRLHPQVLIERDLTLALFGKEALAERARWLEAADSLEDEGIVERRAQLLYDQGTFREAKGLLERHPFAKVHQRYKRSELWSSILKALGEASVTPPSNLGEDDLATYGAYRVEK